MLRVPLAGNKSSLYGKEEMYCSYQENRMQKAKYLFFSGCSQHSQPVLSFKSAASQKIMQELMKTISQHPI